MLFSDCLPVYFLSVASDLAEWSSRGYELFGRRIYAQAAYCFERAGEEALQSVAEAYALRQQTRSLAPNDPDRATKFAESGEAFFRSAKMSRSHSDKKDLNLRAAQCFGEGGHHIKAAEFFVQAEAYTDAVEHYRKALAYDQALELLRQFKSLIPAEIASKIIELAKLEYTKTNQIK